MIVDVVPKQALYQAELRPGGPEPKLFGRAAQARGPMESVWIQCGFSAGSEPDARGRDKSPISVQWQYFGPMFDAVDFGALSGHSSPASLTMSFVIRRLLSTMPIGFWPSSETTTKACAFVSRNF